MADVKTQIHEIIERAIYEPCEGNEETVIPALTAEIVDLVSDTQTRLWNLLEDARLSAKTDRARVEALEEALVKAYEKIATLETANA